MLKKPSIQENAIAKAEVEGTISEVETGLKLWKDALKASAQTVQEQVAQGETAQKTTATESGGVKYDLKGTSFTEDRYFARKMDKWDELSDGSRVKVGVIQENSALHQVGLPASGMYFDVGKIKKAMDTHGDHLTAAELKSIPELLENPIVIAEYTGKDRSIKNTVNVYGNLFFRGKPIVVRIVMRLDRSGNNVITNVRTIHAQSDVAKRITNSSVLYLDENKKEPNNGSKSAAT